MSGNAAGLAVALAALAGCVADDDGPSRAQQAASEVEGLTLEISNETQIAGRYVEADTVVEFASEAVPGQAVSVHMTAGSVPILVWYLASGGEEGAIGLDVQGRLGDRERAALAGFSQAMAEMAPFPAEKEATEDGPPQIAILRDYAGFLGQWTADATEEPVVTMLPDGTTGGGSGDPFDAARDLALGYAARMGFIDAGTGG